VTYAGLAIAFLLTCAVLGLFGQRLAGKAVFSAILAAAMVGFQFALLMTH
jgi:hypothetical protein